MQRILITGGAGNVGGALARRLVADKSRFIFVIDNLSTGDISKLPQHDCENYKFLNADVNDLSSFERAFREVKPHIVFHYAAVVGVERTVREPLKVLEDFKGIRNILDLAVESGVERVFFSSSSEVYGEPSELPLREEITPLNARLPYAVIKNLGEVALKAYKKSYGLDYTIFRFFNTFGPLQSDDFVVARFIARALRNQDLTINGDGSQTRTFCYVDDNIEATLACLDNNLCVNETLNVGSDIEITILELANIILNLIPWSTSKIVHRDPLEEGDMTRRRPDIATMKKLLGRNPISIEEGIRKTINALNIQHD